MGVSPFCSRLLLHSCSFSSPFFYPFSCVTPQALSFPPPCPVFVLRPLNSPPTASGVALLPSSPIYFFFLLFPLVNLIPIFLLSFFSSPDSVTVHQCPPSSSFIYFCFSFPVAPRSQDPEMALIFWNNNVRSTGELKRNFAAFILALFLLRRWNSFPGRHDHCLQEQHRSLLLRGGKRSGERGRANTEVIVPVAVCSCLPFEVARGGSGAWLFVNP